MPNTPFKQHNYFWVNNPTPAPGAGLARPAQDDLLKKMMRQWMDTKGYTGHEIGIYIYIYIIYIIL